MLCNQCLPNDTGLLTHNIYDFGKGKYLLHLSQRKVQHEPEGMRREFQSYSLCEPHTLLTGTEKTSATAVIRSSVALDLHEYDLSEAADNTA